MSKQPLGKTLLRNVIRHTDAHNKIQEEMEMWKMRDWENQKSHHKHSDTEYVRGRMQRVPDQPRDLSRGREQVSEHDDREARYWSRKLYEFKTSDPDRWGHSGFKELYPEEFESDGEKNNATKKIGCQKLKKSKSDTEGSLSKRSKKSSRKKKKKKKKGEEEKHRKVECSSSSDDSSATKDKQRKRAKSQHKNKKTAKKREEDSSSGDSDDERERERRTHRRKKRKQDSHKDCGPNSKKKRRKNWKAVDEESSDDSSGD